MNFNSRTCICCESWIDCNLFWNYFTRFVPSHWLWSLIRGSGATTVVRSFTSPSHRSVGLVRLTLTGLAERVEYEYLSCEDKELNKCNFVNLSKFPYKQLHPTSRTITLDKTYLRASSVSRFWSSSLSTLSIEICFNFSCHCSRQILNSIVA